MKIEGTFQGHDPIVSGESKSGNQWRKTEFEIITDDGRRPSRKVFTAFNNTCDQVTAIPKGARVEVRFDFDSEEYTDRNGQKRYSHNVNCFGVSIITARQPQVQYRTPQQPPQPYVQPMPSTGQYVPPTGTAPQPLAQNADQLPPQPTPAQQQQFNQMPVQGRLDVGDAGQYNNEFPY